MKLYKIKLGTFKDNSAYMPNYLHAQKSRFLFVQRPTIRGVYRCINNKMDFAFHRHELEEVGNSLSEDEKKIALQYLVSL